MSIYTADMYYAIESRTSWESIIPCSPKVIEELNFWDTNVTALNGRKLFNEPQRFDSVVYSDTSEQGLCGLRQGEVNLPWTMGE